MLALLMETVNSWIRDVPFSLEFRTSSVIPPQLMDSRGDSCCSECNCANLRSSYAGDFRQRVDYQFDLVRSCQRAHRESNRPTRRKRPQGPMCARSAMQAGTDLDAECLVKRCGQFLGGPSLGRDAEHTHAGMLDRRAMQCETGKRLKAPDQLRNQGTFVSVQLPGRTLQDPIHSCLQSAESRSVVVSSLVFRR